MVITRVKNASPSMILTAFDVKFHAKQNEIPPEVCRPFKKPEKNQCRKRWTPTKFKKNNVGPDRTGFKQEPDQTGF